MCLGGSIISIVECFYFVGKLITDPEIKESGKINHIRVTTNNKIQDQFLKQKKRKPKKKKQLLTERFTNAFGHKQQ